MRSLRRTLAGFAAVAAVLAIAPAAAPAVTPRTPIRHFLMLMQEGHSFDNYFGTYPGADGIPRNACMPVDRRDADGRCVRPFRLGDRSASLPHGRLTFLRQFRRGRMDGFVTGLNQLVPDRAAMTMGFYDARDVRFHRDVADRYVLFDRFFASAAGGSLMNHMYWLTGTPGDPRYPDQVPPGGFRGIPTIFDRLQERGVSWKVYVEDYDPRITFRTAAGERRGLQATWMPLLSYPRYVDDRRLRRHIVGLRRLFTDADRGTLPAVAYVVPAGSSEHPPGRIAAGARLVRRIVNSLLLSRSWSSSAFLWTYDTWGGWYDHVPPPQVDAGGYGFRVPALLVSPYARRHHIDHTRLDFTSALRFIEDNWRLAPLARRDARATTIASAFDFASPPRAPVLLPSGPAAAASRPVRRSIIYVGYGGAALLAAALAGLAAARRPARVRRHRWSRDASRSG